MTGGKRIKKATARHEFYLRLFGYCRGKCGLPHPEQKAGNVATPAPKRKPNMASKSSAKTTVGKRSIQQLQQEAVARGRKWVKASCTRCSAEVLIHVEWQNPLVMCKGCRAIRETQLRAVNYLSKAFRPRMPTEGLSVRGGLPSLGKRR